MTTTEKDDIILMLEKKREELGGSQNKLAKYLGVAPATLTNIFRNMHNKVSDMMWKQIRRKVEQNGKKQLKLVDTPSYTKALDTLKDCHQNALWMWGCADSGHGKSRVTSAYAAENKNVFLIQIRSNWTLKKYLEVLTSVMGIYRQGARQEQLMEQVSDHLISIDNPMIIVDEANKCRNDILRWHIDLYNDVCGECAIFFASTWAMQTRIDEGLSKNTDGYEEFFSRIGKKLVPLINNDLDDYTLIADANGMTDAEEIKAAFELGAGDLRRLERVVHKTTKKREATEVQAAQEPAEA